MYRMLCTAENKGHFGLIGTTIISQDYYTEQLRINVLSTSQRALLWRILVFEAEAVQFLCTVCFGLIIHFIK